MYQNGRMEAIFLNEYQFIEAMELIVDAMKERGYDPYMQLLGYVTQNEPTYVTSHNGARALIKTLDFNMVKQYVDNMNKFVG